MNDVADEPSKPTSAEPELRTVSDEELRCILEKHEQWVAAEDKTDLNRADLAFVDLREQSTILTAAQLQQADLSGAELQNADLAGAQLPGANLRGAQLQRADLYGAQLQGAHLIGAQLQGAILMDAQLQGAELQAGDLASAQLQGASLGGAQLQGANLYRAQLRGAYLEGTVLEAGTATLSALGSMKVPPANLTDADFRDADLSNAQLSTVTGLRAEMLAGAVLTNAKLPDDVARFDALKHVEETSRNAITVFFGLLAASLYSWLTIWTTTDVALITGTASSPLPIINTNIALSGFYLAAPLILIAVYIYFHLYLQRLWRCLASLPAIFPDGQALDDKAYPWLLNGLVRTHFQKLKLKDRPLTGWENFVSILLAWWVVPFTLVFFWLRFLPRHDWPVTALHVVLIALAAWFGVHSYKLAVRTLRGEPATENRGDRPLPVRMWRTIRRYRPGGKEAAGFGVGIVVALSVGAEIEPGSNLLTTLGYETYADLTDDEVSTKPSGWTGRDETAEVEIAQVKGADLKGRDLRAAGARRAFLVQANLEDADLSGADLSGAVFSFALLSGANLSGGTVLYGDLSGANFHFAYLSDADFSDSNLTGADLSGAILSGASLSGADLSGANLSADLTRAFLIGANIRGANLSGADLSGVLHLTQAQLDEACGDDKTRLPEGLTITRCRVAAPPASSAPPPGSS